MTKIAFLQ